MLPTLRSCVVRARSYLGPAAYVATVALTLGSTACGAIYPRYTTMARPAPDGLVQSGQLSPAPDFVQRITVVRAEIARQTRDGRNWDEDGPPDAYVIVSRNGEEVLRTPVAPNSLRPEWPPGTSRVDLRVRETDTLRFEIRDQDPVFHDFVAAGEVRGVPPDARNGGNWSVRLEGGTVLELQATPPPPSVGMGLTWEYRTDNLRVIALEESGPAFAGGLRVGDSITTINGRPVSALSEGEIRTALDRNVSQDVTLVAQRNGANNEVIVRRDAVYITR